MPYKVEPQKCARADCPNEFIPHRWGRIKSQSDGWFHQRDGVNSWCPEHVPVWVSAWREERTRLEHRAIIQEEIVGKFNNKGGRA